MVNSLFPESEIRLIKDARDKLEADSHAEVDWDELEQLLITHHDPLIARAAALAAMGGV